MEEMEEMKRYGSEKGEKLLKFELNLRREEWKRGEKGRWKKSDGNVMWDGLWDGCSFKNKIIIINTHPQFNSIQFISFQFNSIQFTQLHKHSNKSLKMKDESEGLIANRLKQVEHMVVDSLVSVMVDVPD